MDKLVGRAFSPSGISGFFEVITREKDGTPIKDPERIGSRGGGFALCKGVTTEVRLRTSNKKMIEIFINGKTAPEAETTKCMVNMLLEKVPKSYYVEAKHVVEVPIGAGFGTSAAGALSCGLALSQALSLNLTYNEVGRMAHIADVVCHTGLGTVEGLMVGGLVLVVKSGAIGIGLVDRIPIPPNLRVVAGSFKPMKKSDVILSPKKYLAINKLARKTMKRILANPSLINFLRSCKYFSLHSGLATERVKRLIQDAEDAGALGSTQNMIGEAVHAIVDQQNLDPVYKAFRKHLPEESILVSEIDFQGARLLS